MKTITIAADSIKPIQQKNSHSIRTRILGSNYKSINVDSINQISELVSNKKLRETSNIFYIKLNEKSKDRNLLNLNKVEKGRSATLNCIQKQKNIISILPHVSAERANPHQKQKEKSRIKVSRESIKEDQEEDEEILFSDKKNQEEGQIKFKEMGSYPDVNMRTLYFYKKQSLNTQLEFFKAYNRYQKSKIYNRDSKFNTELIGTQKTYYHKMRPLNQTKRSISVNYKEKQQSNKSRQSSQKQEDSEKAQKRQNNNKLIPINWKKNEDRLANYLKKKPQRPKKYSKQEYFEPWSYVVDEHENQN